MQVSKAEAEDVTIAEKRDWQLEKFVERKIAVEDNDKALWQMEFEFDMGHKVQKQLSHDLDSAKNRL